MDVHRVDVRNQEGAAPKTVRCICGAIVPIYKRPKQYTVLAERVTCLGCASVPRGD